MIFSFDMETNGLWGKGFAIGAVVYDNTGNEIDSFLAKLPDSAITDEWVKSNIDLSSIATTHDTYKEMVEDLSLIHI